MFKNNSAEVSEPRHWPEIIQGVVEGGGGGIYIAGIFSPIFNTINPWCISPVNLGIPGTVYFTIVFILVDNIQAYWSA